MIARSERGHPGDSMLREDTQVTGHLLREVTQVTGHVLREDAQVIARSEGSHPGDRMCFEGGRPGDRARVEERTVLTVSEYQEGTEGAHLRALIKPEHLFISI